LLNVKGYFDKLMGFIDHTAGEQFVEKESHSMILLDDTPDGLLQQFETYKPPKIDKAKRAIQLANS